MLFTTAKSTSEYLLLFVTLVGLGYAQNGSNNSKRKCFVSQYVGDAGTTLASVIRTANPLLRSGIPPNKGRLCTVPPQPANGVRKIHERSCSKPDYSEDCDLLEGDALLPGNVMNYSCDPGYTIRGNPFVMCDRSGKWSPIPDCVEVKCDPLSSASTNVECLRHRQWVDCDSPEHVGGLARVSCRSGYKPAPTFTNHKSKIVECNMNGKWEPEPMRCEPVCGRVTRNQGTDYASEFPWHASIYKQTTIRDDAKSYVCSGTVVGANLVLTAAHCILDKNTNGTMDPGKLFVMAGHAIEVWNHSRHDLNVVNKIAVKNVYMNCDFRSVNKMHSASDIALLEVEKPFEFSSTLAPACLEDYDNGDPTLDPSGHGSIADFQKSVERRYLSRSSLVKYVSLKKVPYISYEECKSYGDSTWSASLANDQFCAGHSSGSSNCVHSTGGGLMLMKNGLWYVMGIVSKSGTVRYHGGRNHCNHLAIYTNVSEYTVWIRDVMLDLDRYKSHPPCDRDGPFISLQSEITNYHRNFPRMKDVFCLTPPHPANGEWKSECIDEANCIVLPGTKLEPGRQLIYSCAQGYKVNGTTEVYCRYTGNWSNIPTCIEIKCEPLNSESRRAICSRHHKKEVTCDFPVLPETRAEIKCLTGYEKASVSSAMQREDVECMENGMWLPEPITCSPMCGVETPRQQPFVVHGMNAHVGDFPWHATLYMEMYSPELGMRKEFICGATIIRTNILLTAAHCVYDESHGTTVDPKTLFVLTGNMYRDYDSPLNANQTVSKSAVKNIYKHCLYCGQKGNYQSDIALLELQTPFKLSNILLPACLYDSQFDTEQILRPGTRGRIAGFGKTLTNETSKELQTAELPFIPLYQCQESTSRRNEGLLNKDKFCAGNMTGPAVCEGDSGGGLVFKLGRLWHILGIVSVGLETDYSMDEIPCGKYPYSLYTKVSDYVRWIDDAMFKLEKDGSFPSCPNRG